MNKQLATKFKALEDERNQTASRVHELNDEIYQLARNKDNMYRMHLANAEKIFSYSKFYEILDHLKSTDNESDASEFVIIETCKVLGIHAFEVLKKTYWIGEGDD